MSEMTHETRHDAKRYFAVFFGLLVLTALTVTVSGLKVGIAFGIILALMIATVKGSMVALHFMHLNSEKRLIYFIVVFALFLLIALITLVYIAHHNVPEGLKYVS